MRDFLDEEIERREHLHEELRAQLHTQTLRLSEVQQESSVQTALLHIVEDLRGQMFVNSEYIQEAKVMKTLKRVHHAQKIVTTQQIANSSRPAVYCERRDDVTPVGRLGIAPPFLKHESGGLCFPVALD